MKHIRTYIVIVSVWGLSMSMASAQDILNSMPYATVVQDTLITRLLQNKISGVQQQEKEVDGYRVQVYSSNSQQKAKSEAIALEEQLNKLLDEPVYVQYMPPFWKVRIGDFTSYEQAQEFKEQVIALAPELQGDTYVVRDKIHVIQ